MTDLVRRNPDGRAADNQALSLLKPLAQRRAYCAFAGCDGFFRIGAPSGACLLLPGTDAIGVGVCRG
ncbi:hypothetical protein GGR77_004305 [Xanthomonas translucens]